MAKALNAMAAKKRRAPPEKRIVIMSRQSSTPSLELAMLHDELVSRVGEESVSYCLTEPETKSRLGFVTGTLRQLDAACRNKVVVADGYSPAVSIPEDMGETRVIQIWHAIGAVKKFGYQSLDMPAGRSSEYARVARMHKNYDIVVAAGPGAVKAYAEAFGYPEEKVVPLGSPAVDFLLRTREEGMSPERRRSLHEALPCLDEGKRVILYAPTLRKGPGSEGWIDRHLRALASCCDAKSTCLVFSGHPLDCDAGEAVQEEFPCLSVARGVKTVELLQEADVVVTDYSSVAFEAGLLGKDTCFYVPDVEQYRESTGLNVDWVAQGVGLASTDAEELMSHIAGTPDAEAERGFESFRSFVADYFAGVDAHGTQRIADLALRFLES